MELCIRRAQALALLLLLCGGIGIFKTPRCSGPCCGGRHELALPKQLQAPDCKLFMTQKHVALQSALQASKVH